VISFTLGQTLARSIFHHFGHNAQFRDEQVTALTGRFDNNRLFLTVFFGCTKRFR
jgi:hypothetical protein